MTEKINGHETPIESWIVSARPGARFIYFTSGPGRLISDLEHKAIREAAMRLSDEGRVFLLQRKLAVDVYEYRAVVREPRPEKMKVDPPKFAGVKWL
jgi:hypothetical protein